VLLKRLYAIFLLVCFCSVSVFASGIYLTESEFQAIRQELQRMSADTTRLRSELNAQQTRSEMLLEMSERLQERLELALTRLEASEMSLAISEEEMQMLLSDLAALRAEYSILWESWMKQKNETQRWRTLAIAGWISAGAILIGGLIWGLAK